MATLWLLLFIYAPLCQTSCQYAILPGSSIPEAMGQCNTVNSMSNYNSVKRSCDLNTGYMLYNVYNDEDCSSMGTTEYYYIPSKIPCYVDHSIDECESVQIDSYSMTFSNIEGSKGSLYRINIGSPYTWQYRPGDNFTAINDVEQTCYFDTGWNEYFGHFWIYDECLQDPTPNALYPYVKGEYFRGGFETNCTYKIHYYSDSKCRNEIHSILFDDKCKSNGWGVLYTYDIDCPWRPNTVWTVIFCVLGCCLCSCCWYYNIRKGNCQRWKQNISDMECDCKCCGDRNMENNNDSNDDSNDDSMEKQKKLQHYDKSATSKSTKSNMPSKKQINIEMNAHDKDNYNDECIDMQPTLSFSAMNCVICLDVLLDNESSKLRCGHKFHVHCIEEYQEANSQCPLCRKKIAF